MHIVDAKVFIWCHTVSGEDADRKAGDGADKQVAERDFIVIGMDTMRRVSGVRSVARTFEKEMES
jgi:hypothetical protein